MKCTICNSRTYTYFNKVFDEYILHIVEYLKCEVCGFVFSRTHYEMTNTEWENLNKMYHSSYHGTECCADDLQWVQRLNKQAAVIADLSNLGLLPATLPSVDFGCGDGKLSNILNRKYGLELLKFDRFEKNSEYLSEELLFKKRKFGFVITTSVFEHLRSRKELDEINSLVDNAGVMGIHTLVAEQIPCSPEWFYLLPVHCAFFTNKSMEFLFKQWGYSVSIYEVDSRLWFWFKTNAERVEEIICTVNEQSGRDIYYHFKRGFMDYWKLNDKEVMLKNSQKNIRKEST